ncbi:MAG TPA: hypothetical protein VHP37_28075 [Burkholderiales bacterium]|nr:hypothetical protein [Burkholderiales bacterium]
MVKKPKTKESKKMDAATTELQSEQEQVNSDGHTGAGGQSTAITEPTPAAAATKAPPDLTRPHIKGAIKAGLAAIKEGKSKADAARLIYDALQAEDKELIVAAFVEGATLTPKGALTYWYNCKRKTVKR